MAIINLKMEVHIAQKALWQKDMVKDMAEKMVEVRCPCQIIERNNKIFNCNQLLFYATPGSVVYAHCRKCKRKLLVSISKDNQVKTKIID